MLQSAESKFATLKSRLAPRLTVSLITGIGMKMFIDDMLLQNLLEGTVSHDFQPSFFSSNSLADTAESASAFSLKPQNQLPWSH
jgi:hypothetical protein